MYYQAKYIINEGEAFDPEKFGVVNEEIILVNERTAGLPDIFKASIIVSFLKNHSLLNAWIAANPQLTKAVISGSVFTGATEALFEACRANVLFPAQLEIFLTGKFTPASIQP